MNAPAVIREAAPIHDLAWWAAKAERAGTDWDSLLASHLSVLALCGLIERKPSSFELACRRADARELSSDGQLKERIGLDDKRRRPTPIATVEAIKQSVRNRGLAALKEPTTRGRLAGCDVAARAEIDRWLTRFKGAAA
jgi:hypothetical protein